jgi:hypothetical protein
MFMELSLFLGSESDIKGDIKKDVEVVCAGRFEESERERTEKEEYERIFRLLLKEVQSQP